MNMIHISTHPDYRAIQSIANPAEVSMQVRLNRLMNEWFAVFRAENDVHIVFCERLTHGAGIIQQFLWTKQRHSPATRLQNRMPFYYINVCFRKQEGRCYKMSSGSHVLTSFILPSIQLFDHKKKKRCFRLYSPALLARCEQAVIQYKVRDQ
jgi:hypothetical protein